MTELGYVELPVMPSRQGRHGTRFLSDVDHHACPRCSADAGHMLGLAMFANPRRQRHGHDEHLPAR
jgi:hypothetical protein